MSYVGKVDCTVLHQEPDEDHSPPMPQNTVTCQGPLECGAAVGEERVLE